MTKLGMVSVAVMVAMAGQGCAAHHVFPRGLRRSAPAADRIAFYQRYRRQPPGAPMNVAVESVTVDGVPVEHSEDLVPLVGRRSRVRQHSLVAVQRERRGEWVMGGGFAAAIASSAGSLVLLRAPTNPPVLGNLVVSSIGTAGLIVALVGWFVRGTAAVEHSAAFSAYDDDLLLRLGLCAQPDGSAVDCASPQSVPTNPQALPQSTTVAPAEQPTAAPR